MSILFQKIWLLGKTRATQQIGLEELKGSHVHIPASVSSILRFYICDLCCQLLGCIRRCTSSRLCYQRKTTSSWHTYRRDKHWSRWGAAAALHNHRLHGFQRRRRRFGDIWDELGACVRFGGLTCLFRLRLGPLHFLDTPRRFGLPLAVSATCDLIGSFQLKSSITREADSVSHLVDRRCVSSLCWVRHNWSRAGHFSLWWEKSPSI